MAGTYFCRFELQGVTLGEMHRLAAEWMLGLGRFEGLRERRLRSGIDERWTLDDLASEATDLHGEHEAEIEVRRSARHVVLDLRHRDPERADVTWRNLVRLRSSENGVRVEHGTRCTVPFSSDYVVTPRPPTLVRALLALPGVTFLPREYRAIDPLFVPAAGVALFVDDDLLDASRELPWVVVAPRRTPDTAEQTYFVDPVDLASRLVGMGRVAVLRDVAASFAFTEALGARGLEKGLSCFDGGVRVYGPRLAATAQRHHHPLWLGDRLAGMQLDEATGDVVRAVATVFARRNTPTDFWEAALVHDRERAELLRRMVKREEANCDACLKVAEAEVAELKGQLSRATAEMADLGVALDRQVQDWVDATDEAAQTRHKCAALEAQLGAKSDAERLRDAGGGALTDLQVEALRTALQRDGRMTPELCLRVAELLSGGRLIVLDEAWESARAAADFNDCRTLQRLLLALGGDYVAELRAGKGDALARRVFGTGHFAGQESETTRGSDRAQRERARTFRGKTYVMWKHLKLGVADNTRDAIRVHFEWDSELGAVIVGHCGEHLYLPTY